MMLTENQRANNSGHAHEKGTQHGDGLVDIVHTMTQSPPVAREFADR